MWPERALGVSASRSQSDYRFKLYTSKNGRVQPMMGDNSESKDIAMSIVTNSPHGNLVVKVRRRAGKTWLLSMICLFVLYMLGFLFLRKENSLFIFQKEGGVFMAGDVEFELDKSDKMEPKIWVENRVYLFRADNEIADDSVKAGRKYRLGNDLRLHEAGSFAMQKTDQELSRSLGVGVNRFFWPLVFVYCLFR
jgi:hypothetical protein